jgi:hypothetical protein
VNDTQKKFLTPEQAHKAAEILKANEGRVYVSRQRFGLEVTFSDGKFLCTYVEDGGADNPDEFSKTADFEAYLCGWNLNDPSDINMHMASILSQLGVFES